MAIWGKKEQPPQKQRVTLRRTLYDHTFPERFAFAGRKRLAFSEIESAYTSDGLVFRGINKKSRDMVKKWHHFAPVSLAETEADAKTVELLSRWARRVNLYVVVRKTLSDVLLYGDGYIEKVWDGDEAATNEPPSVNGPPSKLVVVNPTTIRPVRDTDPNSRTLGELLYFEQVVPGALVANQKEEPDAKPNGVRFHPSRIEHVQFYDIGDDTRGVGAVEAAYINIKSKMKGDVKLGDIIRWYATGFFILKTQDGNEEDVREGHKTLKSALDNGENIFSGTDAHDFDIKQATQVDPTGIITSFFYNLAGALDMPKDMLIGASAGAVSGSQTNLRDYYEDTQAMVEELTPLLENLYAAALQKKSRDELDVRVVWNRLYVDEKTEADTLFQNAQAASVAFRDGVMTMNEYRARINLPRVPDGDRFFEPPAPVDPFAADDADEEAPEKKLSWRDYDSGR